MKKRNILFLFILFTIACFLNPSTVFSGVATLSWDPPTTNADGTPLTDLAGYKVYYGTSSGNYSQSIDAGNVTTYTVNNLTEGLTYYFTTTSYDTSGNQSVYSNEVNKVIPSSSQQHTLTVSKSGTGTGTVTSSPAGISCGSDCSETYNQGTKVTLTATANASSTFSGWSGACSGNSTCTITMDTAKAATATFTLKKYTITSSAGPGGSISPSGSISVNHGANQTFTITPDNGYNVSDVMVDKVSRGALKSYTFTNVTSNHNIEVRFKGETDITGLPKTGQTTSYAQGDDGYLQAGIKWPEPRFTDNADGTVTDNLTGLMWLKDGNCLSKKRWKDSFSMITDFNNNPKNYNCLGYAVNYSDWRLLNINELESVINYGVSDSATWLNAGGFIDVKNVYYWASTTFNVTTSKAWLVRMSDGYKLQVSKANSYFVWPVRSGNVGGNQ